MGDEDESHAHPRITTCEQDDGISIHMEARDLGNTS
jgi:hypothetical protein